MFIIFDLDDTLIDTSGSIIPPLLHKALKKMVEQGLVLDDFERSYQLLRQLNENCPNTREALKEFLQCKKVPLYFYDMGIDEIYNNPTYDFPIRPVDQAPNILEDLSQSYCLALVSHGKARIQEEKMDKAGILKRFFQNILFCGQNKKESYIHLVKEKAVAPEEVFVCGDRISIDLTPAKELGFKTIQMKWGRGLGNTGLKRDVDYTIYHLKELKKIVGKYE